MNESFTIDGYTFEAKFVKGELIALKRIDAPCQSGALSIECSVLSDELQRYFKGNLFEFKTPIRLQGTPFQCTVWEGLQRISYGTTQSYSELASKLFDKNKARAVANAVGANPILILVPCHRIVRLDGSMGGFSAGVDMKEHLLNLELCGYAL